MLPAKQQKGIVQTILEGGSNRQIVRKFGNATMHQVMESKYPAIGTMMKSFGDEKIENVIAVIIKEASAYFGDAMADNQALEVATDITVRYKWLKMEDIFVAINQLKEQNVYGKLTPNKILNQVKKYSENRMNAAAEKSLNTHLAGKEPREDDKKEKDDKDFKDFAMRYEINKVIKKDKAKHQRKA